MSTARIEAISEGFQRRPGCGPAAASGTSVASRKALATAGWRMLVEQEQFTRSGHLAEHLSRFGYTLPGIGGRGTNDKLFWSVR